VINVKRDDRWEDADIAPETLYDAVKQAQADQPRALVPTAPCFAERF
jgi:hypothetical protein